MESNTPFSPGNLPPFQSPPPIIVPPPPARPRKSRGWMIVAIILFLLLGLSLLANFGQMLEGVTQFGGAPQRTAGPRLDEIVIKENRAANKIAVVPVEGIIMGSSGDRRFSIVEIVKAQLERAESDKRVKAVVLKVNSPGGEVLASDDIARALTEFQDRSGKPVVVSMGSLAASGGYYISAPCAWIVANELTITGSIGVIMHGWNYRGLMDKVGVRPDVYKSGRFKDMLSGSRKPEDVPPEERAMVQKLIDETYTRFKQVVADGRTDARDQHSAVKALAPDWAEYADGRVLSGKEAYAHGFVDQLGNFEDAVTKAEELAKIKEPANLIEYRQRNDLAELFSLFGQAEGRAVKLDLGLDVPKLEAGRMYFLSPLFFY